MNDSTMDIWWLWTEMKWVVLQVYSWCYDIMFPVGGTINLSLPKAAVRRGIYFHSVVKEGSLGIYQGKINHWVPNSLLQQRLTSPSTLWLHFITSSGHLHLKHGCIARLCLFSYMLRLISCWPRGEFWSVLRLTIARQTGVDFITEGQYIAAVNGPEMHSPPTSGTVDPPHLARARKMGLSSDYWTGKWMYSLH